MDRMVGARPGAPEDARRAAGIGEPAADRIGEFLHPDIVGARRQEQKPGGCGQLGREIGRA